MKSLGYRVLALLSMAGILLPQVGCDPYGMFREAEGNRYCPGRGPNGETYFLDPEGRAGDRNWYGPDDFSIETIFSFAPERDKPWDEMYDLNYRITSPDGQILHVDLELWKWENSELTNRTPINAQQLLEGECFVR